MPTSEVGLGFAWPELQELRRDDFPKENGKVATQLPKPQMSLEMPLLNHTPTRNLSCLYRRCLPSQSVNSLGTKSSTQAGSSTWPVSHDQCLINTKSFPPVPWAPRSLCTQSMTWPALGDPGQWTGASGLSRGVHSSPDFSSTPLAQDIPQRDQEVSS